MDPLCYAHPPAELHAAPERFPPCSHDSPCLPCEGADADDASLQEPSPPTRYPMISHNPMRDLRPTLEGVVTARISARVTTERGGIGLPQNKTTNRTTTESL